ncbi:MAG: TRAM domain-containing protein [Alphaproteobacteria bacterium]
MIHAHKILGSQPAPSMESRLRGNDDGIKVGDLGDVPRYNNPMTAKQTETISITSLGAKGDGVGAHEGKPVYVAKTAPGDVVSVRLEDKYGEDAFIGRLQSVVTPGLDRTTPPCPHFDKCGSCSLQHVTPEFYRDWKIAKVQNALTRAGVSCQTWEDPVFLPAATRRRVTMAAIMVNKIVRMGYNEARTHNILNIENCLALDPALDAKTRDLREFLPRLMPDNKPVDLTMQMVDGAIDMVLTGSFRKRGRFSFDQDDAMGAMMEALNIARISIRETDRSAPEVLLSRAPVLKKFGGLTVDLPPAAFLQASAAGEKVLSALVTRLAEGTKNIADLFCGCGTFSGHLLAEGRTIYAADGDARAIDALHKAARGVSGFSVHRRDLFKNPLTGQELSAFDCVVFDPPRAGAAAQTEALAFSGVPKIIAISCNPATFARDAALLQGGGYRLSSLTLIDQFVYTAHVEVAGLFVKA